MAEARVLKVNKTETVKNGYMIDLVYSYAGNEYNVEIFSEYELMRGDIIYV